MKTTESYVPWHILEPTTETLLKFCLEHGYAEDSNEMQSLKECLKAIKEKNTLKTISNFKNIIIGKEGFNEWYPDVVYKHENEIYVQSIFNALISMWLKNIKHVENT